jgi:hypothetical protein
MISDQAREQGATCAREEEAKGVIVQLTFSSENH